MAEPDLDRLRADVQALSAITRSSAREGERESASWLHGRLMEVGAEEVRIEPFRYQPTYALAHGAHNLAGIAAAAVGGAAGAALAAATLASYELEVSGRSQWLRKLLPKTHGANVVARKPATRETRATLVLTAHHDAANTGLVWHPRLVAAGSKRHLSRRSVDPFMAPLELAITAAALPHASARAAAAALLALSTLLDLDVARSATVPGASDNASGVAACLELARNTSLEHTDLIVLFAGCEESGMGGMAAFLKNHPLDPHTTFVLGLDTLGAGTPILARAEGTMRAQRYRDRDLALADEGAAIVGEPPPRRWRIGAWTDPILAVHRGIPTVSLLSMGPGYLPHYHHPSDTPENVDYASVARCARIAAGTIEAFDRRAKRGAIPP